MCWMPRGYRQIDVSKQICSSTSNLTVFFSTLEKRYDPDIKGRVKTRHIREKVEKALGGKPHSGSHLDLLRLSLAPNPSRDPSHPLTCRIVTTNFDLLFEDAWRLEFGTAPVSFDARMAPRPGAHNFEGVIHLHGALSDSGAIASNYILSSRDFARVYLRSGVIGNYIYDLIRRYTLVLIGYSADDPPMRYLMDAIGEDASLFDDMKTPYAITDLGSGSIEGIEQAVWRSKEISAVFYHRRAGPAPFAPLWESIHMWADWARDPTNWIETQLETHTAGKYQDATPFQQAFVQDLLSVLDREELARAIAYLNKQKVDFSWINAVYAAIEATKTDLSAA
ncbi:SIR2 family protein [Bradyrhizobium elkanii]|uniref:SIR2 family protein n=1 Tax=Bradyrhizobium elkanii TaxID=29448 RepID=UPI0009B7641E|nr:SIR2 family protein [Bradyrhizobium elkanii]